MILKFRWLYSCSTLIVAHNFFWFFIASILSWLEQEKYIFGECDGTYVRMTVFVQFVENDINMNFGSTYCSPTFTLTNNAYIYIFSINFYEIFITNFIFQVKRTSVVFNVWKMLWWLVSKFHMRFWIFQIVFEWFQLTCSVFITFVNFKLSGNGKGHLLEGGFGPSCHVQW